MNRLSNADHCLRRVAPQPGPGPELAGDAEMIALLKDIRGTLRRQKHAKIIR